MDNIINTIIHGDCLDKMELIEKNSIDLIYLDPPFFTQTKHTLQNKERNKYRKKERKKGSQKASNHERNQEKTNKQRKN